MLAFTLLSVQAALMVLEWFTVAKDGVRSISLRYGGGLGMANWSSPSLYTLLIEGMILGCLNVPSQKSRGQRKLWEKQVFIKGNQNNSKACKV
jgi:hypothetical protein